jgi:leucine dehydrogenase
MVMEKGILWAPDFLINAGGLINVYSELHGFSREHAMAQAENIYQSTTAIFASAKRDNVTTIVAAKKQAESRIEAIGKVKLSF